MSWRKKQDRFADTKWNELPIHYVPCHKPKFRYKERDRDHLSPSFEQRTAPKACETKKPARCVMTPSTSRGKEDELIHPPDQEYALEFLSDMIKLVPSTTVRDVLIGEFKLPKKEAIRLRRKVITPRERTSGGSINVKAKDNWLKEYKRVTTVKIINYIATVMASRRTKRTRYIAATFLKHFCDLTGEYCNLNNPQNRLQRIQVYIADRIAAWLANIMAETDKQLCEDYIQLAQRDMEKEPKKKDDIKNENEQVKKQKKPVNKKKKKSVEKENVSKKQKEGDKKKPDDKKKEVDKKVDDKKKAVHKKKKVIQKKVKDKEKEADKKNKIDNKKHLGKNKEVEKKKESEHKKKVKKKKESDSKNRPGKPGKIKKKDTESKTELEKKEEVEKKKTIDDKKKPSKNKGTDKKKGPTKKKKIVKKKEDKKKGIDKKKKEKPSKAEKESEEKKTKDEQKKKEDDKGDKKEVKSKKTKQKDREERKVYDKDEEEDEEIEETQPKDVEEKKEEDKDREKDEKIEEAKPKDEEEKKEEDKDREKDEKIEEAKPKDEEEKKEEHKGKEKDEKKEDAKPKDEEEKKEKDKEKDEKKEEAKPKDEEEKKEDDKDKEKDEKIEETKPKDVEEKKEDDKDEEKDEKIKEIKPKDEEEKKEDDKDKEKDEKIEEIKPKDEGEKKEEHKKDEKVETGGETKPKDGDDLALDRVEEIMRDSIVPENPSEEQKKLSKILNDQIKKEIGKALSPDDEKALKYSSDKIAQWVENVLEKAKKEKSSEANTVYYIMRSKDDSCFYNVRKISVSEACTVSRSARYERMAIMSDTICKSPTNPGPSKTTEEIKEWAKWATNVVGLAEKWASWIDRTCEEAENKAKIGKKDDPEWQKFKGDIESQANELRRNKKTVEKSAKLWKNKYQGQFP